MVHFEDKDSQLIPSIIPSFSYQTMADQFVSISRINQYYGLLVLYNCVANIWLSLVGRTALKQNLIAPSKEVTKKLAVVTGSNTGIGFETARRLVQEHGWDVILACRSKDKALMAKDRINESITESGGNSETRGKAIVLEPVLDLSDFDSIRTYANALQTEYGCIDVLINNAGLNTSGRSPGNPELNLMFQSNYLGHFLLTDLLLKNEVLLSASEDGNPRAAKIINLSSVMHHFSKGDSLDGKGFESIESTEYWERRALYTDDDPPSGVYAASKLAAILHAAELNKRYGHKNLTAIAVNPGGVNSDIWRGFPMWLRRHVFERVYLTTKQGSEPIIAAAIRGDLRIEKANSMESDARGAIIYIQPYANPFTIFGGRWFADSSAAESACRKSQFRKGPMPIFSEMIGPYVGHLLTIPRLPTNTAAAAQSLWRVSEQLTKL